MRIIECDITEKLINTYRKELFLLNESVQDLQDKKIIKLINDDNKLIGIAMYSKLATDEIELYLNVDQQKKYLTKLSNSIYLDAVTALHHGFNCVDSIINYLKKKFNSVWCYSHIHAVGFWQHNELMQDIGENLFVSC